MLTIRCAHRTISRTLFLLKRRKLIVSLNTEDPRRASTYDQLNTHNTGSLWLDVSSFVNGRVVQNTMSVYKSRVECEASAVLV